MIESEECREDSNDGEQRLRDLQGGEERTQEMEKQLSVVSREGSEGREEE